MRHHLGDCESRSVRILDQETWRSAAVCVTADPELFFPVSASRLSPEQVAEAKTFCGRCPVRSECLDFAYQTHSVHGIWGGLTEEERLRRAPAGVTARR
jgi:WhiB family redox-sensing transcriptional regulator